MIVSHLDRVDPGVTVTGRSPPALKSRSSEPVLTTVAQACTSGPLFIHTGTVAVPGRKRAGPAIVRPVGGNSSAGVFSFPFEATC